MNGVPDFCQLILITTCDQMSKNKPSFRKLCLALREAGDYIKLNPLDAKQMWYEHRPDDKDNAMMNEILDLTIMMFPSSHDMSKD